MEPIWSFYLILCFSWSPGRHGLTEACRFSEASGCWYVPLGGSRRCRNNFVLSTDREEDSHVEVSLPSDWLVSYVDNGKKIYNYFGRCLIPFYECIFSQLKFVLPFTGFEEWVLRRLKIFPSQLHLVSWVFVKIFQYWCEYRDKESSVNLIFNLFNMSCTSKGPFHRKWLISLCQTYKMLCVYMNSYKNFKDCFLMVLPQTP